jgi:D-alanyl-D-alanine dipeptidase
MEPWLAPYAGYLLDVLTANGITYTITSVYRSRAKQEALYARWLKGQNKYPVAPPGTSKHELGLAMDVTMPEWVYAQLGKLWVSMGGKWNPADEIHFSV